MIHKDYQELLLIASQTVDELRADKISPGEAQEILEDIRSQYQDLVKKEKDPKVSSILRDLFDIGDNLKTSLL